MRVGSLFSGIGGIELGLERAGGFEPAWFVENDPHAQAILRKHWPNAQVYGDITTLDFASLPPIDVLTGGFPCQDISKAGKGAGIAGRRSSLWKHYLRAIGVLRPKIVFAENVSILTDRGLDVVLSDLASLGYDAEWHCVPAAAVGAYHRRDRIIILAYPNGGGLLHGQAGEHAAEGEQPSLSLSLSGGPDGSNTCSEGLQGVEHQGRPLAGCGDAADANAGQQQEEQVSARRNTLGVGGDANAYEIGLWERPALQRDALGVITTKSGIRGVADGVPCRVDRIKQLGNAVVPHWAQAVGEAIKEAEGR